MKKKRIIILAIIVTVVLIVIAVESFNPIRKSDEEITEYILTLIPMGSSIEEVIDVIEARKIYGWKWDGRVFSVGILYGSIFDLEERGSSSIKVKLGTYLGSFPTFVFAEFGFDENSKLIDVFVHKETDTP